MIVFFVIEISCSKIVDNAIYVMIKHLSMPFCTGQGHCKQPFKNGQMSANPFVEFGFRII